LELRLEEGKQITLSEDKLKYLRLLSEQYPSVPSVCREIINLQAILNLPKGTEHFMSDLHGEYEAFYHLLNNFRKSTYRLSYMDL